MSRRKWLTGLTITGGLAIGLTTWNQKETHVGKMLPKVIPGEEHYFLWKRGKVFYTKTGYGKSPLILLHGISPGASSFEWRKLVPLLDNHYAIYTLDLLGFGKSEKPAIIYDAGLYIELLRDFLHDIVREPAHIVASSLSGAFAFQGAGHSAEYGLSLTMISPPDLDTLNRPVARKDVWLQKILNSPIVGTTFYNSLATKAGIYSYLKRHLYHDEENVTSSVVNYYYQAAHQDGVQARRAPASFMSGHMNIPIENDLRKWTKPLLIIWGKQSRSASKAELNRYTEANPASQIHIAKESGLLPHDEQADDVALVVHRFIQDHAGTSTIPNER